MSVDLPWRPLSPGDAAQLFREFGTEWCVAGGWALDLFLGRQTRPHADTDIQVPRHHLGDLHVALPGWSLYAAEGSLTRWQSDEIFPESTSDIWCRRGDGPWEFQLNLVPMTAIEWVHRRDERIRGPLETLIIQGPGGIPLIAPEIQLLYKSKLPNRPKDEADFRAVVPALDRARREWLAASLGILYGTHPWLSELDRS